MNNLQQIDRWLHYEINDNQLYDNIIIDEKLNTHIIFLPKNQWILIKRNVLSKKIYRISDGTTIMCIYKHDDRSLNLLSDLPNIFKYECIQIDTDVPVDVYMYSKDKDSTVILHPYRFQMIESKKGIRI